MKVFALLCLIGLAAGTSGPLPFQPQTQYTFQYEGRLLSGIPELATHFSGLGIKCTVQVQVASDSQRIGIQIQNPQYVRVSQKLGPAPSNGQASSQVLNNWRLVQLPSYQPIPSEHVRYLQTPVVFEATPTGEFRSMKVDQQQPDWSVNFKKALVYLFQTNFQQAPIPGMVENEIIPSGGNQPEPFTNYYETEEQGLDGVCKVTYQINQLPEYMIKENPDKVPYPQACQQQSGGQGGRTQYYEIVKTKDASTCRRRTSFSYYKPGFFRCPYGSNCEGMWAKSSITRYVACGPRQGQLTLQSILNEGELQQNLMAYKSEKFLTGTRQLLKLQGVQKMSQSEPTQPQNPVQLDSLFFQYFFQSNPNGKQTEEKMSRPLPRKILSTGSGEGISSENTNKIKEQIKQIVNQMVTQDLQQTKNVAEKQVTMKALSLSRAFDVLDLQSIDQVYQQLKQQFSSGPQQQVFKNIFFDALLMGGTTNNILYIVRQAQQQEISQSQLAALLTSLPQYVLTPTPVVLNQLYELITSQQVQQSPVLYSHGILAYSTLIQRACLAHNRVSSYPTFVFGNFCNPDSQIVYGKWIPYLQRQLIQAQTPEQQNIVLVALGQLSHKSVLPAVLPYIENTQPDLPGPNFVQPGQQNATLLTRSLAVYALSQTGRQYPQIVLPILFSVFSNQGENPEVRIAALQTIIRINPPITYLQRIAATTWQERDIEVLQVVNTIFYSLSQQRDMEQLQGIYNSLQRNAWLVYPLIKRTGGRIPSSGSTYNAEYLQGLGVGYVQNNEWVNGQSTGLPSNLYQRVTYYLDRYQFNPLEVGLRVQNYQNLLQQIIEIIYNQSNSNGENGSLYERISEGIHEEWGKVMKKLKIKERDGQQAQGALYVNFMENFQLFYNLQSSNSGMLKDKIKKFLSQEPEIKKFLQGQQQFNFQRLINLSPYEASIPSDMGFPILVEVHMPLVLSIRGDSNNQILTRSGSQVHCNVQALLAGQYTGWVGTVVPFLNEFVVTGIDKHLAVNIPANFNVQIDVTQQQFNVEMTPLSGLDQNQQIDLVHFHVKPFTVHQQLYNLQPMTLNPNLKVIDSASGTQTKEFPISQYFGGLLGFNLKTKVESQTPFLDLRTVAQKMQLVNNNPVNLLRFILFDGALTQSGRPSFRKHEVKLRYEGNGSNTKSVKTQVKFSFLSKKLGESILGHTIEESVSSPLPYKIVSKEVDTLSSESLHHKVKPLFESYRSGKALGVQATVVLSGGSRPRTFTYNLNFINGLNLYQLQEKFNVQLQSQQSNQKLCLDGQVNLPQQTPPMDIDQIQTHPFKLNFQTTLGFGQSSCQESQIKISGQTKSSQSVKEYSRNSPEGREYRRMEESRVPMYKYSEVAKKVRDQASLMDEVDVTVHYQNVPQQSISYQTYQYLINFIRGRFWSNIVESSQILPPQNPQQNQKVNVQHQYTITLQPYTQAVNVTIQSQQGQQGRLRIQNVGIPYPLGYIYPFPGTRTGPGGLLRHVTGSDSFNPVCNVQGQYITGYKNQTRRLSIDNCFHLLTGECGAQKDFAVLVREQQPQGPKEIQMYLLKAKIELRPTSSHSRYNTQIQLIVNGQNVQLQQGQIKAIRCPRGSQVGTAQLTSDNQILIKSALINVQFNGYDIQASAQGQSQGQRMCGLCGGPWTNGPVSGPEKCLFSKSELLDASYRVENMPEGCKSLDRQIKEELEKEKRKCDKVKDTTTKVWTSYKSSGDNKCTLHRHEILDKHSQICFSRKPTTQCGERCHPHGKVIKEVSFTCMGKSRMSERYERKIRSGEILPELLNLPESFEVKMSLPRSCQRY